MFYVTHFVIPRYLLSQAYGYLTAFLGIHELESDTSGTRRTSFAFSGCLGPCCEVHVVQYKRGVAHVPQAF